jgi:adenylate cyclase
LSEATGIRQRLAAILAADAVGYSRLMAQDDQGTVETLDGARSTFRNAIHANSGRVIDMAGDSVLAVFETAAGAVGAALDVQRVLESQAAKVPEDRCMRFRIGVHLGDLIEKPDGSIYGEGVNIASRLQVLASPGGVTVSDAVRSSVRNRVRASFEDMGEQQFKNIADPVHAFRMHPEDGLGTGRNRATVDSKSIAVLPFVDLSEKHDQEYFSDGLSEELIDHLSHAPGLKVIARTSSFQFKGKNEDVRLIAQRLGVAHLLEGSVRRSGDELRITAQLIRASDGTHLWSRTYDRSLKNIFKLQDEIANTVAEALQVAIHTSSARRESRPSNTQAYNLLLEGDFFVNRMTKADMEKAIERYKEAIKLDPNYALAWANLGNAYHSLGFFGSESISIAENTGKARDAVDQALRIDPDLPWAHKMRANILIEFDWDWQGAEAEYRRAIELDPDSQSLADSLASIGWMFGRIDDMIAADRRSLERNPLSASSQLNLGFTLFTAGRLEEAASAFRRVSELKASFAGAKAFLAATLLFQGKKSEALTVVEQEPDETRRLCVSPIVYWDSGRRADSDAALSHLEKTYALGFAYNIAQIHAYRGEVEAAFAWLERAFRQRDAAMPGIKVDPMLRKLHADPRYQELLVRMKLDGDGSTSRS